MTIHSGRNPCLSTVTDTLDNQHVRAKSRFVSIEMPDGKRNQISPVLIPANKLNCIVCTSAVPACLHVHCVHTKYPQTSEEDVWPPASGVTNGWVVYLHVGAGN